MWRRLTLGIRSLTVLLMLHGAARAGWDLADILVPNMLGAGVATLEENAGRPVETHDLPDGRQVRLYDVRHCNMLAYLRDGRVEAFELALEFGLEGPCTMQLGPFLGVALPVADAMTLGDVTRALGLPAEVDRRTFGMSCLNVRDCPGAEEPTAEFFWQGPQGLQLRLSLIATFGEGGIQEANVPAMAAADAWERAMRRQGEGRDYVVNARFNCDDRYQREGIRLFAAAPVNLIQVGRGLGNGQAYSDRCR
jgi:hypothetical protein